MPWPMASDYQEALQHPSRHFHRPDLKRCTAVQGPDGKPCRIPGQRVDFYELRAAGGLERWAIGCFVADPGCDALRLHTIADHLQNHAVPAVLDVEWLDQGINVRGRWYPLLRSRWIDSVTLPDYVARIVNNPLALRTLASAWLKLGQELRRAQVAHGNLGGDRVLLAARADLANPRLTLVDLDCFFVPALANQPPTVAPDADYAHPRQTWPQGYSENADRFALLSVYVALEALADGGQSLWDRYPSSGNLLFRASDFQDPAHSAVFQELWRSGSPRVRDLAGRLVLACVDDLAAVPPVDGVADKPGLGPADSARVEGILGDGRLSLGVTVEDEADESDAFALHVEDDLPSPTPPVIAPPPLPVRVLDPRIRTYQFDAWMPQQVAVMKMQGFVKDNGGAVIASEPGLIRVHLLDLNPPPRPAGAAFLGWLGLVEQPPPAPRVLAILDMHMVHKPTPQRTLIGVAVQLTPGEFDADQHWLGYCDRVYCDLRAYLIGSL